MLMPLATILYNKPIFETITICDKNNNSNENNNSTTSNNNNQNFTTINNDNITTTNTFHNNSNSNKRNENDDDRFFPAGPDFNENLRITTKISVIEVTEPSRFHDTNQKLKKSDEDSRNSTEIDNEELKPCTVDVIRKKQEQETPSKLFYTDDISIHSIKNKINEIVKENYPLGLYDYRNIFSLTIQNSQNVIIGNKTNVKLKLNSKSWAAFAYYMEQNFPEVFFMIPRVAWNPLDLREPYQHIRQPLSYVVILHSATEDSRNVKENLKLVHLIQRFHVKSRGWNDIGYNFLIGQDGNIYEGRGWGVVGAHTIKFNTRSIGIAFIGCFLNVRPTRKALQSLEKLLKEGVEGNYLKPDYRLVLHCQLTNTLSPGQCVTEEIVKWNHFYTFKKADIEEI